MERHAQLMNFLHKVTIFENLTEDRISKIADVMDQVSLLSFFIKFSLY